MFQEKRIKDCNAEAGLTQVSFWDGRCPLVGVPGLLQTGAGGAQH